MWGVLRGPSNPREGGTEEPKMQARTREVTTQMKTVVASRYGETGTSVSDDFCCGSRGRWAMAQPRSIGVEAGALGHTCKATATMSAQGLLTLSVVLSR